MLFFFFSGHGPSFSLVVGGFAQARGVGEVAHLVDLQRVGGTRLSGRGTGSDDHEVAVFHESHVQQAAVNLCGHFIRVAHHGNQYRLDAPGQRQLVPHVLHRSEREDRLDRAKTGQAACGVTGLGERTDVLGVQLVGDFDGGTGDGATAGLGLGAQRGDALQAVLLGGLDDPGHDLDGLDRVLAHAGLAGEHDRVGAVEHRVGAVGGLGAGGARVVDHGLEHLGGHDDRLGPAACQFDGALLNDRHFLQRKLHAEVATGHHDGVERVDDFVELLHGLRLLDLGDHRNAAAFFIHDLVDALDVRGVTHEGQDNLRWAMRRGVDMVALSFVRDASDIKRVHEIMDEEGRRVPVIAKIEKPQAVEQLHEIIDAFDAIMVARGDLGVELPLEEVPIVQKRAIELARRWAKPVIVATQVLESMIENPRPTRAEASDCANAVLDGADAVMLSGETSVGKYPIETVKVMARIIESTEVHGLERVPPLGTKPKTRGGAITRAAVEIADQLEAKYICTFTQSGDSARRLSRLRPIRPVFAFTPVEHVWNQLALTWGIQPVLVPMVGHTDEMTAQVDRSLLEMDLVEDGDMVVIAAGSPPGKAGSTNLLKVHKVGDLADAGSPAKPP